MRPKVEPPLLLWSKESIRFDSILIGADLAVMAYVAPAHVKKSIFAIIGDIFCDFSYYKPETDQPTVSRILKGYHTLL